MTNATYKRNHLTTFSPDYSQSCCSSPAGSYFPFWLYYLGSMLGEVPVLPQLFPTTSSSHWFHYIFIPLHHLLTDRNTFYQESLLATIGWDAWRQFLLSLLSSILISIEFILVLMQPENWGQCENTKPMNNMLKERRKTARQCRTYFLRKS